MLEQICGLWPKCVSGPNHGEKGPSAQAMATQTKADKAVAIILR